MFNYFLNPHRTTQFNIPYVFIFFNVFQTNMSSSGERNRSQQENRTLWKSTKAALYAIRAKGKDYDYLIIYIIY